jgi:hypothetical protein
MPPIKAVKNQYVGINAHLHSYWQAVGGWPEFHTAHIVHLWTALNSVLLPRGYSAALEKSLQIRHEDVRLSEPESDLTIYDVHGRSKIRPAFQPSSAAGTFQFADVPALMEEHAEYRALKISTQHGFEGQPVVWIELLSPSNKPGQSGFKDYFLKRHTLLHTGLVFVEMDYLNNARPTLDVFKDGLPYRIALFNPHPSYTEGRIFTHPFAVDEALPTIEIPLLGADVVAVDFNTPYHRTIAEGFFAQRLIDYAELPRGVDAYRLEDQQRILARMNAIAQAVRDGVDLEAHAPLPA